MYSIDNHIVTMIKYRVIGVKKTIKPSLNEPTITTLGEAGRDLDK